MMLCQCAQEPDRERRYVKSFEEVPGTSLKVRGSAGADCQGWRHGSPHREEANLRGVSPAPDWCTDEIQRAAEEADRAQREILRLFGDPIVKPPIFNPEVGIYPVED